MADFESFGEDGSYWLTKHKFGITIYDANGERLSLATWLPQTVGKRIEAEVQVGSQHQLPCRLVTERVPAHVIDQRPALEMAQWTIYLTNTPLALLTADEVFVLARYRWQIELLFKLSISCSISLDMPHGPISNTTLTF